MEVWTLLKALQSAIHRVLAGSSAGSVSDKAHDHDAPICMTQSLAGLSYPA
jgi:hypothetical protein